MLPRNAVERKEDHVSVKKTEEINMNGRKICALVHPKLVHPSPNRCGKKENGSMGLEFSSKSTNPIRLSLKTILRGSKLK